jgi:hypothetical protein
MTAQPTAENAEIAEIILDHLFRSFSAFSASSAVNYYVTFSITGRSLGRSIDSVRLFLLIKLGASPQLERRHIGNGYLSEGEQLLKYNEKGGAVPSFFKLKSYF